MPSTSNWRGIDQTRKYHRSNSAVFLKTKDAFGGLSNMAGGFPLRVNRIRILTAEALYQACRFPHLPEAQRLIIEQRSPMTAKMKSKPHRKDSRPDWKTVRVKIMRWCLRVKLAQNWDSFSKLLLETGDRPIVEESRRDDFWGAKPVDEKTLVGMNVLGRLLMELREAVKSQEQQSLRLVEPLAIPDFLLAGQPIEVIAAPVEAGALAENQIEQLSRADAVEPTAVQASLFDPPTTAEIPSRQPSSISGGNLGVADLPPYPAMKDSGVPWLGHVPAQWEVLPNRAVFVETKERDRPGSQMLSVTINAGVVPQEALLAGSGTKDSSNLDKSAYKVVHPGDIVYNKMRAWQGAVGLSAHQGIVSPAYVVQRPRALDDPRYMHYLLRTPSFAKEAERWSYGITSDMWSLRPEHFRLINVCLPSRREQVAIVRFLNDVDRRVARYIRARRMLIKLLDEQRQAVIYRAVSRGLDPDVRLKASGVEWLGEVPEHWAVVPLRLRYSQSLGKMLDSKRILGNHLLPYLRNTDVQWDRINVLNLPTMDIGSGEYGRYTVQPEDLLVCEGGEVGRSAIWSGQIAVCGYQKALHRLRPQDQTRDVPRFMYYVLRAAAHSGAFDDGHKSTIAHLTGDKLRAHRFPFPSLNEQSAIVESLDASIATANEAVETAEREIALIGEFRTRLIADVVTGKRDVREAAARLPDEREESEPYEEIDAPTKDEEETADDLDAIPDEVTA